MRVFIRMDKKGALFVVVWKKEDCVCSRHNRNNCAHCRETDWLPPKKIPIRREPFTITLPVGSVKMHLAPDACRYQYRAHGSFNLVYRSDDQKWVLKIPIDQSATDLPDRAVRVWNEINPGHPAQVIRDERGAIGWVAPFIDGIQPTQAEIAQKILEIYEKTGRIVADAFVTSNFVKTADGSIVCIDIGNAFLLESRPPISGLPRVHSQVSLDTWNGSVVNRSAMSDIYRNAFCQWQNSHAIIIHVTKALLYLQMKRPDFRLISALLENNSLLINLLASSYDKNFSTMSEPDILRIFDMRMALCARAQPAAPAVIVSPSSDDDRLFIEVSPSTDASSQAQSVRFEYDHDVSPYDYHRVAQKALPAAWLGQDEIPKYDSRLFPFQAAVHNQVNEYLSKFNNR